MNFKKKRLRVPVNVPINILKQMYSEPKIFEATYTNAKGIKKPCVKTGCTWYVYFYYRHPVTNKMSEKFVLKRGVNLHKTVAKRRYACEILRRSVLDYLKNGYDPFDDNSLDVKIEANTNFNSVLQSFNDAFESRRNEWKSSTIDTNTSHFDVFKKWLKAKKIEQLSITEFKRRYIVLFLDYLIKIRKVNKTTRNNYKRTISSLLTKMVELELIEYNPADKIKMLKSAPTKNKSFSKKQLQDITDWLKTNDPYLHQYLKFISYAFMRPIEVNRMKIKNIDLDRKIITVDTKTNQSNIPIISILEKVIVDMDLTKYESNDTVFTKKLVPFDWITQREKSKYDFFDRRFKKLKDHFNFGADYGMYSFRHNAALNLYHSFVGIAKMQENEAVNKLQKIMRHTDSKTTRFYLRDIGAFAVADYSADYTFEF